MNKILIVGSDNGTILYTLTSSLGKKYKIDILTDQQSPALYSHNVEDVFYHGNFYFYSELLIKSLNNLNAKTEYMHVILINDVVSIPVHLNRKSLLHIERYKLPSFDAFEKTWDKNQTFKFADLSNISTPVITDDIEQIDTTVIDYPVVLKPAKSKFLLNNIIAKQEVSICHNENELRESIRNTSTKYTIQRFVKGKSVSQCIYAIDGVVEAIFEYERVTQPSSGGGSFYRKSRKVSNDLEFKTKALIKNINWSGLAMVEYIKAEDDYFLMEINGRLWGSIALPYKAGLNFPLLLTGDTNSSSYKLSIYSRRFLKDLKHSIKSLSSSETHGQYSEKNNFIKLFVHYFKVLLPSEHIDEFNINDPKPFLKLIYDKTFSKLNIRKSMSSQQWNVKECLDLLSNLKKDSAITFVCKGNICRSIFAEKYFLSKGALPFTVTSSGTSAKSSPSPSMSIEAAKVYKVDLESHLASMLDYEQLKADIIFIFDKNNYDSLKQYKNINMKKVYYLGMLMENSSYIEDPYGKQNMNFQKCYREIKEAIDYLFENVNGK